ncbi:hypothetical protein DTO027B5_5498 [Paecilomyces variotii]|nr:hypothetical protein DTO032I3_8320 [Paecilomyces variotii]KAJ9274508.1 hypothetical protein DTO021D3_8597 [Paecilomyces variotii]KAJ9320863.1 hypothetical protein DTO027B3_8094 [Paecilomyces variotii]KAJ9332714.1 hypothetical protein DTO027B5_5498 [Paecilomyces variotii]KAJ9341684.1 hypothetical protein DTO027B6_5745 [Paecilomyces variotii]
MARDIPGFYYDAEKNKYFKIQANHVAPSGSQYSERAIKQRRLDEKKRKKDIFRARRVATERIKRSSSLGHPLIGVEREVNAEPRSRGIMFEQQGRAYVSQVRRRELHKFWSIRDTPEYQLWFLQRSSRSGLMVAGSLIGGESVISICFPESHRETWTYNNSLERPLYREPYRLSSISLSHTGFLLATMDSGPRGDSILATRRLPNPEDREDMYIWPSGLTHPTRMPGSSSLWCSSPCPTGDIPLFAVGTSDGLHTLEGIGYGWSLSPKPFPSPENTPLDAIPPRPKHSHASVMSVEWLTSEVIVSGLRDSSIFFHDLRSRGTVTRLQHNRSVAKIRKVDEYRLVVSGRQSLQIYDIRYPANGLQTRPKPTSHRHSSTKPYITFPEYSSETICDFDVSPDLGLLAAVIEDHKPELFSLRTGQIVPSPLQEARQRGQTRAVLFESGDWPALGTHTPRLLVNDGPTVQEWTW